MIGSNRIGVVRIRTSGTGSNSRIGSNRISAIRRTRSSGAGKTMSGNIGSVWRTIGTSKSNSGMRMKAGKRGTIDSGWKMSDMIGRCSRLK